MQAHCRVPQVARSWFRICTLRKGKEKLRRVVSQGTAAEAQCLLALPPTAGRLPRESASPASTDHQQTFLPPSVVTTAMFSSQGQKKVWKKAVQVNRKETTAAWHCLGVCVPQRPPQTRTECGCQPACTEAQARAIAEMNTRQPQNSESL